MLTNWGVGSRLGETAHILEVGGGEARLARKGTFEVARNRLSSLRLGAIVHAASSSNRSDYRFGSVLDVWE